MKTAIVESIEKRPSRVDDDRDPFPRFHMSRIEDDETPRRDPEPRWDRRLHTFRGSEPLQIDPQTHHRRLVLRDPSAEDGGLAHPLRFEDEVVGTSAARQPYLDPLGQKLRTAVDRAHGSAPV